MSGDVLVSAEEPTPADEGAAGSLRAALESAEELVRRNPTLRRPLLGIGVSFGGPIAGDDGRIIRSMHVDAWDGAGLSEALSDRFRLPVTIENDANAAALAEATFGAGSDAGVVLYVQISTGIGAGLVVDRAIYKGRGGAGELGHVVADANGSLCGCGNKGCLETVAAGWALAREARRVLDAPSSSTDARALVEAARRGEQPAQEIVARAFSALGTAVADCVNLLDPDVVVIGGGIARAWDVLSPVLEDELERHVVPHLREPRRLAQSQLGSHAPLVGAAIAAEARQHEP